MAVEIIGTPRAGVGELAVELGVDLGDEAGTDAKVTRSWKYAVHEVNHQLAHQFRPVEADVLDALYLEVAVEHYGRNDRVSSGSQYVDVNGGQPVRGPRDPLNRVYPILDRYRVAM